MLKVMVLVTVAVYPNKFALIYIVSWALVVVTIGDAESEFQPLVYEPVIRGLPAHCVVIA